MKKSFYTMVGFFVVLYHGWIGAQGDVTTVQFMFPIEEIFKSPAHVKTDNGIENVKDFIITVIPILSIFMAIAATVMVILGGIYMIIGGADASQTEKWKGVIMTSLIGVIVGLLSYLMIVILWNLLDV